MEVTPQTDLFTAVEIEINHNCNMSCSYCPNSKFERVEQGVMSMDILNLLLEQLQSISFDGRISFDFYNEPLLCPDISEKIAMIKSVLPTCSIELYTNGSLLRKSGFVNLSELGVDKFIITNHESSKVINWNNMLSELSDELKEKVVIRSWQDIQLTNRGGSLPFVGGSIQPLLPCFISHYVVVITVNGTVLPCFEDFFQYHSMGNIKNNHIKDIWYSNTYKDFRQNLSKGLRYKQKVCKECNRLEVLPSTGGM